MPLDDSPSHPPEADGLPLQQTAALLSAWLHTRLGLAGLELGEARDKLVTGLLWSAVALLLAGLGLLTLSIAVTLLFWDTWRWQSLLVLSGIYLVLALWVGWWVRQKMRQGDRFLQATLTVLEQDKQAWSQR